MQHRIPDQKAYPPSHVVPGVVLSVTSSCNSFSRSPTCSSQRIAPLVLITSSRRPRLPLRLCVHQRTSVSRRITVVSTALPTASQRSRSWSIPGCSFILSLSLSSTAGKIDLDSEQFYYLLFLYQRADRFHSINRPRKVFSSTSVPRCPLPNHSSGSSLS